MYVQETYRLVRNLVNKPKDLVNKKDTLMKTTKVSGMPLS